MNNKILDAIYIASHKHFGTFRKYTYRPYIEHPARVAMAVSLLPHYGLSQKFKYDWEDMICAAWCHDLLEDTSTTALELEKIIGKPATELVVQLTNPSKIRVNLSRAERKQIDMEHLRTVSDSAKIIKIFDRTDNLKEMIGAEEDFLKLYKEESLLLLSVIKDGDKTGAFVPELEQLCQ